MRDEHDDPVARLLDSLIRHETDALDQAHIVVSRELRSGRVSCHGPYADPFAALVAAADLETAAAGAGDNAEVVCRVARLWAPLPAPEHVVRRDRTEG